MIRVWRKEVEEYATSKGLPFVLDSTNLEPSGLRNRLRLKVLPLLTTLNPRLKERLLEMAEVLREEDEALQEVALQHTEHIACKEEEGWQVDLEGLLSLPRGLRSRVLRGLYAELTRATLPYRHHQALKGLLEGKGDRVELPRGMVALREGHRLYLGPEPRQVSIKERVLKVPGVTALEEVGLLIEAEEREGPPAEPPRAEVALLDSSKLTYPLRVRSPREGDRFVPSGMKGSKKLQDLFVDHKVPRRKRSQVPVVLSGGEICWVVGMRVDERFRATPETLRTLVLRLKRARQ